MTAITVFVAIFCALAIILPGLAELSRIFDDRNNPIRMLRIKTRRSQLPSASFVGRL